MTGAKNLVLASLFTATSFLSQAIFSPTMATAENKLTIGSPAPALDIENWVSNGKGKFKPVTKFENGKVYVVEFWATWCGPCVGSMPHLVKLQKDFGDKGVQIISITDEDKETVDTFLDREYEPASKKENSDEASPKNYRELTSAYCLTSDPDQSSTEAYMAAAGQGGIPCAFVVGKDQKIEWIGHPLQLDDVLTQVVEDKWDRAKFLQEFQEQQQVEELFAKIGGSIRRGKGKQALAYIEEAQKLFKNEAILEQIKLNKLQAVLECKDIASELVPTVSEAFKDYAEKANYTNMIAWTIYESATAGDIKDKAVIKLARQSCEAAVDKASKEVKPALHDTIAHLYQLEGNTSAAIQAQEKAIALVDESEKKEYQEYLDELKEAMKEKR